MVFSTDATTNKAVVCAGLPDKSGKCKQLEVSEWLTAALEPLKGRCGKGKGGLASGQVSNFIFNSSPLLIILSNHGEYLCISIALCLPVLQIG